MDMNIEIRDNKLHLSGYVNAVERDSKVINTKDGRCVEQIAAGAFEKSLADGHEVRMRLNHKRDIGSTKDGTLELREDKIGLFAKAETEDEELRELAAAGKLTGWSFGFVKREGTMEERANDVPRRRISALDLSEVSILSVTPAYNGTSVEVRNEGEETETRSCDDYEEEKPAEKEEKRERDMSGSVQCFLMGEKIKKMKAEQRYLEIRAFVEEYRYNPYHNPQNGQFTTATGGGSYVFGNHGMSFVANDVLYVGKGQRGNGKLINARDEGTIGDHANGLSSEELNTIKRHAAGDRYIAENAGEFENDFSNMSNKDLNEYADFLKGKSADEKAKASNTKDKYKRRAFSKTSKRIDDYLKNVLDPERDMRLRNGQTSFF